MAVEIGNPMIAQVITEDGTEFFVPRVACTLEEWIAMLVEMVMEQSDG